MDTKTAPADKSDECCFFIGIVLFGREVITLSNPLALRLRKPRIYRTKKAPLQVLFGFFGSTLLRKDNARSQVRNDYFVSPSCTATAHATRFETNQKAPLRMLCVLVLLCFAKATLVCFAQLNYFVKPSWTATAQATEAPTIGLLPMPMRPIISTCAGTDEEPANCASECILPIVSVMP